MTGSDRRSTVFALALGIVSLSCSGPETVPELISDDIAHAESLAVESEVETLHREDPFPGFDLSRGDADGDEERLLALRLRNLGGEDAVVSADAGAGEVFLDSVEAGGWSRVDLLTRGPVVTLRSARSSGETIHRLDLDAVQDSVVEINVGEPAATP